MPQQLTQRLYVATCLQAGRCKGVPQCMGIHYRNARAFEIAVQALAIAARLNRFGFIARQKPGFAASFLLQLLQHSPNAVRNRDFSLGASCFWRLNDNPRLACTHINCFTVRSMDKMPCSKSKLAHCRPQTSPMRSPICIMSSAPSFRVVGANST